MAYGIYLTVDASDLEHKINLLRRNMSGAQFERAMYGIFNRTGKHVKRILQDELPKQYVISPSKVGKAVQRPQVSGTSCIIPIRDKRGNIGSQYAASGGAHGWNSLKRKYKVKARIVRSGQSTLPGKVMAGYPPFRNLGSKLGKLTFTRTSKARGPIMKVSGIAIPQMPMNRSQGEVQQDIALFLAKQIEQRFMYLMGSGR